MIPNHEGPDEPLPHPDREDWNCCAACMDLRDDLIRCPTCGALYCPDCWDEHRAECNDDPKEPKEAVHDPDEDHYRGEDR